MFKYTIEYLTSFGAMTIYENKFNCRSWTKWGAWKKFLNATRDKNLYESRTYSNSFWRKRKDIKFCGVCINE